MDADTLSQRLVDIDVALVSHDLTARRPQRLTKDGEEWSFGKRVPAGGVSVRNG